MDIAKLNADLDRDIHDTKMQNTMVGKHADHVIEDYKTNKENDREDNKENITSGMKATSEDLERAKKKI